VEEWTWDPYSSPKALPTLRASEWKGCGPRGSKSHTHWIERFYLSALVTDSGKLSPIFAERLMGFKTGWTALSVLATQLFHSKRAKRSKDSQDLNEKGETDEARNV
jgi:hypothetical protein